MGLYLGLRRGKTADRHSLERLAYVRWRGRHVDELLNYVSQDDPDTEDKREGRQHAVGSDALNRALQR